MENALRSVTIARRLRKTMTRAEVALWSELRGKRLGGLRFRRQHPLGPYVVDFFCAAHRLAIEVDGDVHRTERGIERDLERDAWIRRQGVRVLRIGNDVVLHDMDGALKLIARATVQQGCTDSPPPPSAVPLPICDGEDGARSV